MVSWCDDVNKQKICDSSRIAKKNFKKTPSNCRSFFRFAQMDWHTCTLRTFSHFVSRCPSCHTNLSPYLLWRDYFYFWTLWSLPWSQILHEIPVKVTMDTYMWLTLKKVEKIWDPNFEFWTPDMWWKWLKKCLINDLIHFSNVNFDARSEFAVKRADFLLKRG